MASCTHAALLAALAGLTHGCSDETAPGGPVVNMDLAADAPFFASPLPSDHRLDASGTVSLAGYPNPQGVPLVQVVVDLLHGQERGFSTTAGVFFTTVAAVDPASLPSLEASVTEGASVFLVDVEPASPDYLRRYPVSVQFEADGGPLGAANLLSLVPLQGIVLRPSTRHAAVITTAVRDSTGTPLAADGPLAELLAGGQPAGLADAAASSYRQAWAVLEESGLTAEGVAGLAVFTTGDPAAPMQVLLSAARAEPPPVPLTPWQQTDAFDDYCVYETNVSMPVFQQGQAPYEDSGGAIDFSGELPPVDHREDARLWVTLPRGPTPEGGWPTAVMIRTGGGGDRPLVDRGLRAEPGGASVEQGGGPARYFAAAGFAGVTVDGPHGGLRNVTGGDEQFLIFNIGNPAALRDNLRQSAVEIALLPDLLADIAIDAADCDGGSATLDTERLALMGHSMGATIAPLVLAVEPRYRAVILSGAGSSYIENVVHKLSPVAVRPLAELLLRYPGHGRSLHEHDAFLNVLQWAGEPSDPPVYGRHLVREPGDTPPHHVLMLQGIVDTYILPPIANATSLSLGLDLAGEALDEGHPQLDAFLPLRGLLTHAGAREIDLPARGNVGEATAVVVQHPEDAIEDGHEVMFQSASPKHQYRCFLQTWRQSGVPTVLPGGKLDDPCD